MTQKPPPARPPDRAFVRDVAKQIDRRRVRRRLTLWTALLALVTAAAFYLRCGGSLGFMGLGNGGAGDDDSPRSVAAPSRCTIRVSATGLTIDGQPRSREEAIAACKDAPGSDVVPTGDVRHGDLEALGAALKAAGARNVVIHGPPRPAASKPQGQSGSGEPGR